MGNVVFAADNGVHGRELFVSDGTSAGTVLLKDIVAGAGGSNPENLLVVGDKVIFTITTADGVKQLWATDGTAAGTRLLLAPNALSDVDFPDLKEIDEITVVGDKAFFAAYGATGFELYVTDGTTDGTHLVKDIRPGAGSSLATSAFKTAIGILGDKLIFRATDGTHGFEIWVTDGTAAGTVLLADVNPGSGSSTQEVISQWWEPTKFGVRGYTVGDKVFFATGNPATGLELWVTDGTSAGTHLVRDLTPGATGSPITFVGESNDKLLFLKDGALWASDGSSAGTVSLGVQPYGFTNIVKIGENHLFSANDATNGREIWISDGTVAGTHVLKDIAPGAASSAPYALTVVGEKVFFAIENNYNQQLWVTDGTAAGTKLVKALHNGSGTAFVPQAILGDKLIFFGEGLWVTQGTAASTKQIVSPVFESMLAYANQIETFVLGNKVVFALQSGSIQLWTTDGTSAGTQLLGVIPNDEGVMPHFDVVDGKLYVSTDAGDGLGEELLVTDGTAAGTHRIADINPHPILGVSSEMWSLFSANGVEFFRVDAETGSSQTWASNGSGLHLLPDIAVFEFAVLNGNIYFTGGKGDDTGLFVTDGTSAGTHLVSPISFSLDEGVNGLRAIGDKLFFVHQTLEGDQLWATDGSGPAVQVTDLPESLQNFSAFAEVGDGKVIFVVGINRLGVQPELWVTDGTAAGSQKLANLPDLNETAANQLRFFEFGGQHFFTGQDGSGRDQLWVTDGTVAGTHLYLDTNAGGSDFIRNLTRAGDKLYFAGTTAANGQELWVIDANGARMVKDIVPGTGGSAVDRMDWRTEPGFTVLPNGRILFAVNDGSERGLWSSDGTEAGTFRLALMELRAGMAWFEDAMTVLNGRLVFVHSGSGPRTVWATDGTVAGTEQLGPGEFGTAFYELGGRMVYASGFQGGVWGTDGTAAGTVQLVASGALSPAGAAVLGSKLVFVNDGAAGRELWITDGTTAGTMLLKDIVAGAVGSNPHSLVAHDGAVYFTVQKDGGWQIWVTDGTAAGTIRFLDAVLPGEAFSLKFIDGQLVFMMDDGINGEELWTTDGTAAGTHMLTDATAPGNADPGPVTGVPPRPVPPEPVPTAGNDVLPGKAGNQIVDGLAGNDTINGGDGADKLYGNLGNDILYGDAGNDQLFGDAGLDQLLGGDGADVLDGGAGNDILDGGEAADRANGGDGDDLIRGGAGIDTLYGDAGKDRLEGGADGDKLYGGDSHDTLLGEDGADLLYGELGNDTLDGGLGADKLYGAEGTDILVGGEGNDLLDGGIGGDTMSGGLGNDTYVVDSVGDKVIELAGEGTDLVQSSITWTLGDNVERLTLLEVATRINGFGNELDNTLTGNSGANGLDGKEGADLLYGMGGDDTLTGGLGGDRLFGGDGDDRVNGGAGNDFLTGGAGADRFVFGQDSIGATLETDTIYDLNGAEGDRLDFSAIDANSLLDGNQKFALVAAFTKQAGQMTVTYTAANDSTVVRLDVNGDGKTDFQVKIIGDATGEAGHWFL